MCTEFDFFKVEGFVDPDGGRVARLSEMSGEGEQISGGGGGNISSESRLSRESRLIGGGGISSSFLKFCSKSVFTTKGFQPLLAEMWFAGLFFIVPPAGKSLSKPRSLMHPEVDED